MEHDDVNDDFDEDLDPAHRDDQAMADLRAQLLDANPSDVVANHAYGLFELAAVYLSAAPPRFSEAQLAIDALGALVETLGDRLAGHQGDLAAGLAQLRLAFVQLSAPSATA